MAKTFPKLTTKYNPGSSENTKQEKYEKSTPKNIILKLQKMKHKEKILKKSRE